MPREMADVVRNHELRQVVATSLREEGVGVAVQTDRRTDEREIVNHITADRGVLWRALRPQLASLGLRGNNADRAPAHAASTKFQIAIESVVQLRPGLLRNELVDAGQRPRGQTGLQPSLQILGGTGEDLSGLSGRLNFFQSSHGFIPGRVNFG